jgi:hypothetical protein
MIDFPSNPANGDVFTSGNSSWVWNAAASQWRTAIVALNPNVQRLSGNGTTTQFTLNTIPPNTNFLDLHISGIYQQKNTYSISGTTLTFTEAPPSGTDNIEVEWGSTLDIGTPSDASVTAVKLSSTAITDKLGYTPVNKAGDSISGTLTVDGGSSLSVIAKAVSSSVQIKLERTTSSAGVGYIGADSSYCFRAFDSTLSYAGLNVDNSGRVTKPYQPTVKLSGAGGSVNNAVGLITTFSVAEYTGLANHWSSSRFTAPVSGRYFISMMGNAICDSTTVSIEVRKNNAAVIGYYYNASGAANTWQSVGSYTTVYLSAGDYIEFYNRNGVLRFDSSNWFNACIGLLA